MVLISETNKDYIYILLGFLGNLSLFVTGAFFGYSIKYIKIKEKEKKKNGNN